MIGCLLILAIVCCQFDEDSKLLYDREIQAYLPNGYLPSVILSLEANGRLVLENDQKQAVEKLVLEVRDAILEAANGWANAGTAELRVQVEQKLRCQFARTAVMAEQRLDKGQLRLVQERQRELLAASVIFWVDTSELKWSPEQEAAFQRIRHRLELETEQLVERRMNTINIRDPRAYFAYRWATTMTTEEQVQNSVAEQFLKSELNDQQRKNVSSLKIASYIISEAGDRGK